MEKLEDNYHIVTPIIDGHGEDYETEFISIEDSAKKLINYIDINCNSKVFAMGGLSLGGQIITDILSKRNDITDYEIIESALVEPLKETDMVLFIYRASYGLLDKKWFSKLEAKVLNVPSDMLDAYYKDCSKMTKNSITNIIKSNENYKLKERIKYSKTKALVIVGEKELSFMQDSARKINDSIINSELFVSLDMGHGELSLFNPEEYVQLVENFF